ncbi:hypothetical protein [Photobacterium kasasachensis]|uniref:hypothetical protein n=1 Tax=Photobacterium kasasachensis TaxID=2910240 RepID=UPI003D125B19
MKKCVDTLKAALANKSVQVCSVIALSASGTANAALDAGAAATAITAGGDQIVSVQTAILGLAAIGLVGRWVKATFF